MKAFMVIFFISFFSLALHAQDSSYYSKSLSDVSQYKFNVLKPKINDEIKDADEKDFKKLREFLADREVLLKTLEIETQPYINFSDSSRVKEWENDIAELRQKDKVTADTVEISRNLIPDRLLYSYGYFERFIIKKSEIKFFIEEFEKQIADYKSYNRIYTTLNENIKNVKMDIVECQGKIDSALAPEMAQQRFRTTISLWCFTLIGILLLIFFFMVAWKSGNNLSQELLSSKGLQFVTLFILIIAIVLFGILGILGGSELAAILSGISGYILGKGNQADKIDKILETTKDIKEKN